MTSSGARAAPGPLPRPVPARTARRLTLAAAAAMLALGLLLLLLPNETLEVTAVLLGLAVALTGMLRLAHGATASAAATAHRSGHMLIGILAVFAGIYCLSDIVETVVLLSLVAGMFWAMHGLVDLVAASSAGPGRALTGVTGALSLVAGLTAIFWPAVTVPVLAGVMGTWLACDGLLLAATALYQRHLARAAAAAKLATSGRNRDRPPCVQVA
jgi:uncharacterized membrane protein HdeD (DUF308 family)